MHELLAPGSRDLDDVVGARRGGRRRDRRARVVRWASRTWATQVGWSTRSRRRAGAPARPSRRSGCESPRGSISPRAAHATQAACIAWRTLLRSGPLYDQARRSRPDLSGWQQGASPRVPAGRRSRGRRRRTRRGRQRHRPTSAPRPLVAAAAVGLDCELAALRARPRCGAIGERRARDGRPVRACSSASWRRARSSTTPSSSHANALRADGATAIPAAARRGDTRSARSATPMPRVSWPSSVIVPGFRPRQSSSRPAPAAPRLGWSLARSGSA